MWIAPKYAKQEEFDREGICTKVKYFKDKEIATILDKNSQSLHIGKNSNNQVLTDVIGISKKVVLNIVFLKDSMWVEVLEGEIYLNSRHNSCFYVCSDGYIDITREAQIEWCTLERLREYVEKSIPLFFDIHTDKEIKEHIANLTLKIELNSEKKGDLSYMLISYDKEIGLGDYVYKEKIKDTENTVLQELTEKIDITELGLQIIEEEF